MLPLYKAGMRVPSMKQHDSRFEDDRDYNRRPPRERFNWNRYNELREDYSPPDDRYRSRRFSRERDERSPHRYDRECDERFGRRDSADYSVSSRDRGGGDRPESPDRERTRVWDSSSSSPPNHVLEHQLQLQRQAAAAVAAAAVVHASQPQLLLPPASFLTQPFVLAPPVDHMALVNMNLAAAALHQQQQHQQQQQQQQQQHQITESETDEANNTIMVRSLPPHINENDIRQEVLSCNLVPKDVRLIRKKDTGYSRGFAFIEFNTVQEAARWMQLKQGMLTLDGHRVIVQYSMLRESGAAHGSNHHLKRSQQQQQQEENRLQDWLCTQCGGNNFRRRDTCYRCRCRRPANLSSSSPSEGADNRDGNGDSVSAADQVSTHPTNTLLLRGLLSATTEEQMLVALQSRTQLPIRSVRVARDEGSSSMAHCYLQLSSVIDAVQLYRQLSDSPLIVCSRSSRVSYCKLPERADDNTTPAVDITRMSIQELAEYSAKMYAKTPHEYETYLKYYEDYYKTHGVAGVSASECQSDSANAAAAVAHTALQRVLKKTPGSTAKSAESTDKTSPHSNNNNSSSNQATAAAATVFDINKTYTAPDTSTFQYDETSGYYYDYSTGLYYDSNTQYFYDGNSHSYVYWDGERGRYVPAPSTADEDGNSTATTSAADDRKKLKHDDKVKVAKKIAKDMERWAKTQNRRDARMHTVSAPTATTTGEAHTESASTTNCGPASQTTSSADVGFAMFGRRNQAGGSAASASRIADSANSSKSSSLVAAYGGESGDEEDPASSSASEDAASTSVHVDLEKMACLLCKRAFASRQQLNKHLTKSQLHRSNLAACGQSASPSSAENSTGYRDRAAERREQHTTEAPPAAKQRQHQAPAPPVSGVGNKMMQAMGWSDGQGLGRNNQGRTDLVQAGRR